MNQVSVRRLLVLLALLTPSWLVPATDPGRSFFAPRPIASSLAIFQPMYQRFDAEQLEQEEKKAPELPKKTPFFTPLRLRSLTEKEPAKPKADRSGRVNLHVTPFYQKSTTSEKLRRAMLPNGKDEIHVGGSEIANPDVSGTWLQIAGQGTTPNKELFLNAFSSKVTIKPEFERYGTQVDVNKYFKLGRFQFFAGACTQFLEARHKLNVREYELENAYPHPGKVTVFRQNAGGGASVRREAAGTSTMLSGSQALNNPLWQYGKLPDHASRHGMGDTECYLGLALSKHFSLRLIGTLPSSLKDTGAQLFEPRLGSGSHWGIGTSAFCNVPFGKASSLTITTKYNYLLQNAQYRSVDLTANGAWSRYLLVARIYPDDFPDLNPQSGVNYLTRKVNVTPKHQAEIQGTLHLASNGFSLDLGGMVGFKNGETVKLRSTVEEGLFVAAPDLRDAAGGAFQMNEYPYATITTHALAPGATIIDQANINALHPITASSLSLRSAEQSPQLYSSLHAAIGFQPNWHGKAVRLALGFVYELNTQQNNLLCSLSLAWRT